MNACTGPVAPPGGRNNVMMLGRDEGPERQRARARERDEMRGNERRQARAGDDAHDPAVQRKLQQDRSHGAGARLESAHVADRSPVKQQPEHQHQKDEAVDVEVKSAAPDRVDFVVSAQEHEQQAQGPRILKQRGEAARALRRRAHFVLGRQHLRVDPLHLRGVAPCRATRAESRAATAAPARGYGGEDRLPEACDLTRSPSPTIVRRTAGGGGRRQRDGARRSDAPP